ncbi:hypothetical protein OEA41_009875 [Lepraria neglecta]|uniref:Uncharacterized protein n=1 Tax=Lepraria neglecta TaxID=209136 RepID=A0AAE0DF20_9LECA|nr:hypothetical protein OEA41_009875 [Lepraria neglecta]
MSTRLKNEPEQGSSKKHRDLANRQTATTTSTTYNTQVNQPQTASKPTGEAIEASLSQSGAMSNRPSPASEPYIIHKRDVSGNQPHAVELLKIPSIATSTAYASSNTLRTTPTNKKANHSHSPKSRLDSG